MAGDCCIIPAGFYQFSPMTERFNMRRAVTIILAKTEFQGVKQPHSDYAGRRILP